MNACLPRAAETYVPQPVPENNARAHFTLLLRRYRSLARSLNATDQRERDRLNGPLMQLYLELHPRSSYRHYDDIETVLRRQQIRV